MLYFGWHGFKVVLDVVDFDDRLPSLAVDPQVTLTVGGISASVRHERAWIACAAIGEFRVQARLPEPRDRLVLSDVDHRSLIHLGFEEEPIRISFQAHSRFENFYRAEITERLSAAALS